ncbi:MAG: hypothetical protein RLZZ127_3046 [Planctomycetota bacterium]|jgi:CxxC motif-containing protein (DUF1111 family)
MRLIAPALIILATVAVAALVPGCAGPVRTVADTPRPLDPEAARSGGAATVSHDGVDAFAMPVPGLTRAQRRAFAVGNSFFNDAWVVAPASAEGRDGLGPLFNAESCSACHFRDGRGRPPAGPEHGLVSALVRLSVRTASGAGIIDPVYGEQIQDKGIPGVPAEFRVRVHWEELPGRYADGEPYTLRWPRIELADPGYGPLAGTPLTSLRTAPMVAGVGLLEAVRDDAILALADPDDRDGDGISGRARIDVEPRSGAPRIGRFGWKAGAATVEQQSAGAFAGDIGITSDLHRGDHATPAQTAARNAPHGGDPELSGHKLQRVVEYQQVLAVPARRNPADPRVRRGEAVFHALRCDACHTPALPTGRVAELPALSDQTIRPYTDLLLHDLGEGLADHRAEGDATGREWRTAPLWGLGLIPAVNRHHDLLHDGRARGPAEAILWHGGEAATAAEGFRRLPRDQREALVAFLMDL